jgi:hypothetical protein
MFHYTVAVVVKVVVEDATEDMFMVIAEVVVAKVVEAVDIFEDMVELEVAVAIKAEE